MADLPRLKAAVATGDPPTVEQVASEYRASVRSDVFAVADRAGRTLASLGAAASSWPAPGGAGRVPRRPRPAARDGLGADPARRAGARAARAPDARLRARRRVRDAAQRAHRQPRGGGEAGPRLRLDPAARARRGARGRGRRAPQPRPRRARTTPPRARRSAASRAPPSCWCCARGPRRCGRCARCATCSAVAAVAAVAVSLLLSWAVARTVTRPLAALTDAMKEIAATGDLARRLGPGRAWDDEDARLVARSFGTLTDSIARFQREASLRERLSALGRLSTVVAHEVRNPLMIIKGSLRALRREGATPAEVREAAADIDTQVARLDRVVGDVLDFARPLRIEPASVDASAIARDAAHAALEGATRHRRALQLRRRGHEPRDRRRAAAGGARQPGRERARQPGGARERSPAAAGAGDGRDREPAPGLGPGAALGRGRGRRDRGARTCRTCSSHTSPPSGPGPGWGSRSRARRSRPWAATLRLDSRPGAGTRVEIELPASPPAPPATESR